MRRKVFIFIAVSLLVIIVIVLIVLPGTAKRYLVNNSKELIGRQIEIKKVKLNYFTGMIIITDFKMFEADNKSEFISFDTLSVNLEPFQFFVNEFVMESFYLKGLKTNVIQYDSTFNFDDLIAFHQTAQDTTISDTIAEDPFRFQLSNIELKDAEFLFDDRTIDKITRLNDISFFIPYIGWDQEDKSEAGLRFAFKDEGYFESSISVDPMGGDFEADIKLHQLNLNAFEEYASSYINIEALEGVLNSDIKIIGNIKEAEKSIVSGSVEVLDFLMQDQHNRKFLGMDKVSCNISHVDVHKLSFIIDTVILDKPYVYFELDSISNNLTEIFTGTINDSTENNSNINSEETDTLQGTGPVYYAINYIQINEGIIDYTDDLTGDSFDYHLSEIEMVTDSIKSTSAWIDLTAQMKLNEQGSLHAEVGFNPSNPMDIDLNYVITDFQLSDLNIYSRYYMGFPIVYGNMYYKSETSILNGQLKSDNELVIENVELGGKSGGIHKLPLKFALFLLKDRHGVINLDIPVRGDLNDPQVSVGKIVWNTFKNLIIKVAAAPFTFLAGLISVDPKDIEKIEFEYGDTTLSERRTNQLNLLLELEQKKEGLDIEMVYYNDIEKEKEHLAVIEMGQHFNSTTQKNYLKDRKDFEDYVYSSLGTDTITVEKACLSLTDSTLIDSLANQYTLIRKKIVKEYLASINDSTQIKTSVSSSISPKNMGSLPLFDIKYSMTNTKNEMRK